MIVCGRNVFWQRLKQEIKDSHSEDFVRLPGFVPDEDLRILYQEATAFVFPSLSEGFGLPILEAMACATPVACSAGTALEEVAGDAGVLFNPLDVSSICQAIERLLIDNVLRDRLRSEGLRRAHKFTWDAAAEGTMALFQSVLHT